MNYITIADLNDRFGQESIAGLAESGVVLERVIADANATADSYVGAVHTLPLPEVPAVLKGPVADIARFLAYAHNPTEEIRQRYEDALKFLRLIATRTVTLNLPPPTDPEVIEGASFDANERLFTRRSLRGF